MEEKLEKLYKECIDELEKIDIHILDEKMYGKIDINLSNKSPKRYGCCKQECPDKKYKKVRKYKNRKVISYQKFKLHHIYVSRWVMEL